MTMTVQEQKKKRRKKGELSEQEEKHIADGLSKALGVKVTVKKPSKEFLAALDSIFEFDKTQSKVDRCFEIGRAEQYTDKQIGNMIRERMKPHYAKETITRVFDKYPEAKQKQNHKKVDKKSTFLKDGKCPKCGKPLKEKVTSAETKIDETQEVNSTDKYRTYQNLIVEKNNQIKEKDKEIAELQKQITTLEHELSTLRGRTK